MRLVRSMWNRRSSCTFLSQKPYLAGMSGWFFLVPAVHHRDDPVFASWFAMQSAVSWMSDFRCSGRDSAWHAIDRLYAPASIVASLFMGLWRHGALYTSSCACLPFVCYAMSRRALAQSDEIGYNLWHFFWHLYASVVLSVLL